MTEPAPWKCPECGLILAPHVSEHRCEPPEGGVSARPVVAPYSPSTGTHTWPTESTITVTPGGSTIWSTVGGGGGTTWGVGDGVTITATNACNVFGDCGHRSCAVIARTPLRLIAEDAA
jgi:hypothetical protein